MPLIMLLISSKNMYFSKSYSRFTTPREKAYRDFFYRHHEVQQNSLSDTVVNSHVTWYHLLSRRFLITYWTSLMKFLGSVKCLLYPEGALRYSSATLVSRTVCQSSLRHVIELAWRQQYQCIAVKCAVRPHCKFTCN